MTAKHAPGAGDTGMSQTQLQTEGPLQQLDGVCLSARPEGVNSPASVPRHRQHRSRGPPTSVCHPPSLEGTDSGEEVYQKRVSQKENKTNQMSSLYYKQAGGSKQNMTAEQMSSREFA